MKMTKIALLVGLFLVAGLSTAYAQTANCNPADCVKKCVPTDCKTKTAQKVGKVKATKISLGTTAKKSKTNCDPKDCKPECCPPNCCKDGKIATAVKATNTTKKTKCAKKISCTKEKTKVALVSQ